MKTPGNILSGVVLVLSASTLSAATPGKLTVEPPTQECVGFHWEISDDGSSRFETANATAQVAYRKQGAGDWLPGLDLMRLEVNGRQFLAGSLFHLEPGTNYEARLTLGDPDGVQGEPTRTVSFTTRSEPVMPTGGNTYHVYPPDYTGAKERLDLGAEGDWRAFLAEPERSPIQPGDQVLFHPGSYQLKPEPESMAVVPVTDVSSAPRPQAPTGGTTWHVYPVDHKGEKLKPTVRLNHYDDPIMKDDRSGEPEIKPGDTVLFHAGTYKVDKHNYRDRLFQGPKWGVWRFVGGGEPGNPVVFKAAGDGEVVFDGDGNYGIFELLATDHLWIDGIHFRNALCALIAGQEDMGEIEGLTVTNCTFEDVSMPIYSETAPSGWHLSGNTGLPGVHAGPWYRAFGSIQVKIDGTEDKPIVLRPADDGEVMIDGGDTYAMFDTIHADHLWIRDFKVKNTECVVLAGYMPFGHAPDGLILTGMDGENVRMGLYADESTGVNWTITDNRFIGRGVGNHSMNQHISPFGISVAGRGHIIAYNHLEWFQDGIDIGWWDRKTDIDTGDYSASIDVYNNYVFGSGDNSIEADGSYFNGRFFRNAFLTDNSPSTQSTPGGPFYFIRNLFTGYKSTGGTFKLPSSIFAFHNVFPTNQVYGNFGQSETRWYNNLFILNKEIVRERDLPTFMIKIYKEPDIFSDYNGYHLVPGIMMEKPFIYGDDSYPTLEAFATATGLEEHSILVPGYSELFRKVPEPEEGMEIRLEDVDFRLKPGSPAIDAGVAIPNITGSYNGSAPDLGAIEFGDETPHYGPRNNQSL